MIYLFELAKLTAILMFSVSLFCLALYKTYRAYHPKKRFW